MTPSEQDAKRYRAAMLKIIEAKASLWTTAAFAATCLVGLGIAVLIVLFIRELVG